MSSSLSERRWHWIASDGTLRDGRPAPPDGEWLVHDGPVRICDAGLHYSERILDALAYAPGPIVCHVTVEDVREQKTNKGVCTRRRIDWRVDATPIIRPWMRWCALQVEHLWDCPDVVRRYLETGDESLRVATSAATWDAAGVATWDAARAAALDAPRAAAWDASWNAALDAARAAAMAAALDAARAIAMAAALDAQNAEMERLVRELKGTMS